LAVRHAIKKPVVQLIQKGEKIPFDVSTTRTIQIDHQDLQSVDEAKQELAKQIRAVEKDPSKVDSPISIAVDFQLLKQSEDPQRKVLAEMRAMMQQIYASTSYIKDLLRETTTQSPQIQSSYWIPAQNRPIFDQSRKITEQDWNSIKKFVEDYEERKIRKKRTSSQ
jgi:hypothetical protein